MKTSIANYYNKPFPIVESGKDKLLVSLGSGVVVVCILIIIRPFGIESYEGKFLFLCGFGLIDFVVTALNLFMLPLIIPRIFENSTWTIGKNLLAILWILLVISLLNYFYGEHLISSGYIDELRNLKRTGIGSWIFMTFSIGMIPVIFALYYIEKKLNWRNLQVARNLEKETKCLKPQQTIEQIQLTLNKEISFSVDTLICVKAEGGNYASVYWQEHTGVKKETIRITLAGFTEHVGKVDSIVRCHKSYIINLRRVVSFQGNARSVTAKLRGLDFNVPVSRSFPREKLKQQI